MNNFRLNQSSFTIFDDYVYFGEEPETSFDLEEFAKDYVDGGVIDLAAAHEDYDFCYKWGMYEDEYNGFLDKLSFFSIMAYLLCDDDESYVVHENSITASLFEALRKIFNKNITAVRIPESFYMDYSVCSEDLIDNSEYLRKVILCDDAGIRQSEVEDYDDFYESDFDYDSF